MNATITSKGQITIPLKLRQKLNLKVGDQLEFDESASVLTARRVMNRGSWDATFAAWQHDASVALENHPWQEKSASEIIDDLRGDPADPALLSL